MSSLGLGLFWDLIDYLATWPSWPAIRPTIEHPAPERALSSGDIERGLDIKSPPQHSTDELIQSNAQLSRTNSTLQSELSLLRAKLALSFATPPTPPLVPPPTPPPTPPEVSQLRSALSQARQNLHQQNASLKCLHAEVAQLRSERDELVQENEQAYDALRSQAEESSALRMWLTKTDGASGQDVLQAVRDVNVSIVQLAAGIVDAFEGQFEDAEPRDFVPNTGLDLPFLELIAERNHTEDPTLVQYALQACIVRYVSSIFEAFCPGIPRDMDRQLNAVYNDLFLNEPQATSSHWRALTHTSLSRIHSSAPSSSTPTPTDLLQSISSTLVLSGVAPHLCASAHLQTFTPAMSRLLTQCHDLSSRLATEFMSARYTLTSHSHDPQQGSGLGLDDVFDEVRASPLGTPVLCTTEFGVVCERRLDEEGIERRVLLRPKVLLEGVERLL